MPLPRHIPLPSPSGEGSGTSATGNVSAPSKAWHLLTG